MEELEIKEKKEDMKKNGWFLTCGICHLSIDTEEPFAEFIHYNKHHDVKSSAFYHVDCFKDKINVSLKANKELDKASRLLSNLKSKIGFED